MVDPLILKRNEIGHVLWYYLSHPRRFIISLFTLSIVRSHLNSITSISSLDVHAYVTYVPYHTYVDLIVAIHIRTSQINTSSTPPVFPIQRVTFIQSNPISCGEASALAVPRTKDPSCQLRYLANSPQTSSRLLNPRQLRSQSQAIRSLLFNFALRCSFICLD